MVWAVRADCEQGYTSVSFFLLLSGFVLAYNYSDRAQKGQLSARNFWIARVSRLYPIYLVALLISLGMLMEEWHVRTHAQFAWGVALTPLMLQGWSPSLSTFWNTPAWTMCTEAFFYLIFPLVILWKRPKRPGRAGGDAGGAVVPGDGAAGAVYGAASGRGSAPGAVHGQLLDAGAEVLAAAACSVVSVWDRAGGSGRDDSAGSAQAAVVWAGGDGGDLRGAVLRGSLSVSR